MKISEILKGKRRGVSFEFFPPRTEKGKMSLAGMVSLLKKYDPLYVSMTYGAGGAARERTKEAVSILRQAGGLEVMPHMTCIGAKKGDIEALLAEYRTQGIENIMALRGDPPQGDSDFDCRSEDFAYALNLVEVIKKEGHFCIGVAVYPEGHIETSSLDEDMEYTKKKIDAGADFAVTQMFFDNRYYFDLIERMKKKGITIPVLPGILPLTDVEKVKQFASICRATIPERIEKTMERFRANPADMAKAGIDFTVRQCRGLIKEGAEKLHFFTLNKPSVITTVLDAIQ